MDEKTSFKGFWMGLVYGALFVLAAYGLASLIMSLC